MQKDGKGLALQLFSEKTNAINAAAPKSSQELYYSDLKFSFYDIVSITKGTPLEYDHSPDMGSDRYLCITIM